MSFQDVIPEVTQNPLPPSLAGENHPATKLQTLRLGQLTCLAQAYGIDLRGGTTKSQIMPILAQAEATGVFRREPKSRYYLLLASRSPDAPLDGLDREIAEEELAAAHYKHMNRAEMAAAEAKKQTIGMLRTRAKEIGVNTFQMSVAQISQAIMEKEVELEADKNSVLDGPGDNDGGGSENESDDFDEGVPRQ